MANDLTPIQQRAIDVRKFMQNPNILGQLKAALPKVGLTPENVARAAITCITSNSKLLACKEETLLRCIVQAATYGLLIDGRHAHLVPYKDSCQLIIDYKGYVHLIRQSPEVSNVYAFVIYEGDEYDITFGTDPKIEHKPNLKGDRGKEVGVYSVIRYKDGGFDFQFMSREEVEYVRDTYSKKDYSGKHSDMWTMRFSEAMKKTVLRNHAKTADIASHAARAMQHDALVEAGNQAEADRVWAQQMGELGGDAEIIEATAQVTETKVEVVNPTPPAEPSPEEIRQQFGEAIMKSCAVQKLDYRNPGRIFEYVEKIAEHNKKPVGEIMTSVLKGDVDAFCQKMVQWIEKTHKAEKSPEPPKEPEKPQDLSRALLIRAGECTMKVGELEDFLKYCREKVALDDHGTAPSDQDILDNWDAYLDLFVQSKTARKKHKEPKENSSSPESELTESDFSNFDDVIDAEASEKEPDAEENHQAVLLRHNIYIPKDKMEAKVDTSIMKQLVEIVTKKGVAVAELNRHLGSTYGLKNYSGVLNGQVAEILLWAESRAK